MLSVIGLTSSLLAALLYVQKVDLLAAIDLKLKDARFRMRSESAPPDRVVVVAIDSRSINELGRWPWDRKLMARLVKNLKAYGARSVALDMTFSEPSTPKSDQALAEAIQESGNVVAGYFFTDQNQETSETSLQWLRRSKIKAVRLRGNVSAVPLTTYPYVEPDIPVIAQASVDAGFFNIMPDRDGVIRTSDLLILYDGEPYPSLALSALRQYLGGEVVLDIASHGVDRLIVGNRQVPVDESSRVTLNYYGGHGMFRTVPAVDIINQRLHPNALQETLVFVGATEMGIYDMRVTPLDPILPGVEIHATAASNILQERFLIRDSRVIILELVFIFLFPLLLIALLSLVKRTLMALTGFSLIIGVYASINYLLFAHSALNIGVLFPLISTALTYLGAEAYRNLVEERQGRFLKKAFSSYVAPTLVGEIIKNPQMLKLGGERREITVLFSDIRGFTTISERLTPEALVSLLNQYLGPMTDIILTHRGTLDKYIGDAIMAIYNAPLPVEGHPLLACQSALAMLKRLQVLNKGFKEAGLPELEIGIGIHTGDVIVGNMGTDIRFSYTAIGDTVNLASRLEGMNKLYETHIIVSESTLRHLKEASPRRNGSGEMHVRELDLIRVKGKETPVTIYELAMVLDKGLVQDFEEALRCYRQRQFRDAQAIFQHLTAQYGDAPSGVFAQRCAEFIERPPDPDWDGVYVAKTK